MLYSSGLQLNCKGNYLRRSITNYSALIEPDQRMKYLLEDIYTDGEA